MPIYQTILTVIGVLGAAGLFAGGGGYLINSFRKGTKEQLADTTTSADQLTGFWREQVAGFKEMVASQNDKIQALTQQVGNLQGELKTKDATIDKYLQILQNRNPELENFMKTLLAVAEQSQTFMANNQQFQKDQQSVLTEIRDFMGGINQHLSTANKDLHIESTVTKI